MIGAGDRDLGGLGPSLARFAAGSLVGLAAVVVSLYLVRWHLLGVLSDDFLVGVPATDYSCYDYLASPLRDNPALNVEWTVYQSAFLVPEGLRLRQALLPDVGTVAPFFLLGGLAALPVGRLRRIGLMAIGIATGARLMYLVVQGLVLPLVICD